MLEHHTDLGAGYRIALKDLELRGAGNLLGAEQSGHAHAVGFDLYLRWLEETVTALRGQGEGRAARRRPRWCSTGRPTCRTATWPTTTSSSTSTADWRGRRRLATLKSFARNCASASARFLSPPTPCSTWPAPGARRRAWHAAHPGAGRRGAAHFPGRVRTAAGGLTAALDDVQLAAEVRRTVPLVAPPDRLGGEALVPALVRALRGGGARRSSSNVARRRESG